MKKILQTILGTALVAALAVGECHAQKLTILHTNDTHSQLYPAGDGLGGAARRKVLIDSIKAEKSNVVLVDAGDAVQGTLYFNLYKGEVEEKVMNALGYDLRILGNHEFDNGMEVLADNMKQSKATWGTANYLRDETPLADINMEPYVIMSVDDSDTDNPQGQLKFVAFLPLNLQPKGMIADANSEGLEYLDPVDAANSLAWQLKHMMKVDYVVAVTHIGYEQDTALIARTKDIDALIGGHSHTRIDPAYERTNPWFVKNAEGKDVLVAQAGSNGKYLGEIEIDLSKPNQLPKYQLIPVDSRLDDRVGTEIEEIIEPYKAGVDALFNNKIAKVSRDLPKNGPGLLNFVADFTELKGKELADNVDLALINKGGLRTDLKKGYASKGDFMTMMPFPNHIMVIEVTGKQLADAFDTMARNKGNGVSANVSAEFDPKTGKCTEVLINGQPIDPDRIYRVATIDYLANGGDYMSSLVDHKVVAESPNLFFEDLINYYEKSASKSKKLRRSKKLKNINPSDTQRMHAK